MSTKPKPVAVVPANEEPDPCNESQARALHAFRDKFTAAGYVPHDPNPQRIEDDLRHLDGDNTKVDKWGNPLGRGGFPRDDKGRALVSSPDGATTPRGPVLLPYGSPSGAAIGSSSSHLVAWEVASMARAFNDPAFAAWAAAQLNAVEEPRLEAMPGGWHKKVWNDPDRSEKATVSRITAEAGIISGAVDASRRGTFLHWVSEKVDTGQDWEPGMVVGERLGFTQADVARFADAYAALADHHELDGILVEASIVNDASTKAGTCDRLYELGHDLEWVDRTGSRCTIGAGERLIGDVKTGSIHTFTLRNRGARRVVPSFRGGYAAQFATYAAGVPYDRIGARRLRWPDRIAPSSELALLVQADSNSVLSGDPQVYLEVVELGPGHDFVRASDALRAVERVANDASVYVGATPPDSSTTRP